MVSRQHIDNFFRINNISLVTSDEEIERSLLDAQWDPSDIACALSVLRGDGSKCALSNVTPQIGVFSDKTLTANAISSLLRIDIRLDHSIKEDDLSFSRNTTFGKSIGYTVLIVSSSVILALFAGIVSLYSIGINPFA